MARIDRIRGILLSTYLSLAGGVRLKQDGQDVQDGQEKERHRVRPV